MYNKSFIINSLCRQACTGQPAIGTAFAQVACGILESGTEKIALAEGIGSVLD